MKENQERYPTELLHGIIQIGLVVADLDAVMQGMRDVYGIEPDSVFEAPFSESTYRGQVHDTPARIANYDHFGVQLEFIEPQGEAASVWRDHLNEVPFANHALHHIRFGDVDDNDAVTELMAARGVQVYQEVKSFVNPGGKSTYYDTADKVGFLSEVVTKKRGQTPEPE